MNVPAHWTNVNKKNLGKLIAALRDPKNEQVNSVLRAELEDKPGKFGYCCLGLACKISRVGKFLENTGSFLDNKTIEPSNESWRDKNSSYLTYRAQKWLGVNSSDPYIELPSDAVMANIDYRRQHSTLPSDVSMTQLNDSWRFTFPQIADMLEYFIYNNLPDESAKA